MEYTIFMVLEVGWLLLPKAKVGRGKLVGRCDGLWFVESTGRRGSCERRVNCCWWGGGVGWGAGKGAFDLPPKSRGRKSRRTKVSRGGKTQRGEASA